MKAAAIYARVSSDQQADKHNSIPSQLRLLKEYADKNGISIYRQYVDEGESALSAERPGFQAMITDAMRNPLPFRTILIWKYSRFARNKFDSIFYKNQLRKKGITVISISEPIDDSPAGELLEGMIEVIDQFYSSQLAQETLRGMIENARQGYRNGGRSSYGYRRVAVEAGHGKSKVKFEINETEARIVRRIFELCLDGNGIKKIAMILNDKGIHTRNGCRWNKTSVVAILKNETYIGWTVFNKRDKRTEGVKDKPRDQWIIVKDTHDPIVSEEIFNRVQAKLESRSPKRTHPSVVNSKYALSGHLRCARCGSAYTVSGYGRGRKYAYFNCSGYGKKGKSVCPGRRIRADKLEQIIIQKVKTRVFSDSNIQKLVRDVNETIVSLTSESAQRIGRLEKELSNIQARISKLYEAIETGVVDLHLVGDRLRELSSQKESMQDEIRECEKQSARTHLLHVNEEMLKGFRERLFEVFIGDNPQEKREFLSKFIDRIEVGEEKLTIYYYAPNPSVLGINKKSPTEDVAIVGGVWLPE